MGDRDEAPTPTPQASNNIRVDYTWYNTLVDDNGTGNGTIWNKAAVLGSLNSVDAGLAKLDAWGQWTAIPFNAANFAATGGTWTVGPGAVQHNRWALVGKTFFWSLYVSWFAGGNVVGGVPTALTIGGLPYALAPAQFCAIDFQAGVPGQPVLAGLYAGSQGTGVTISTASGAPFGNQSVPGIVTNLVFEIA